MKLQIDSILQHWIWAAGILLVVAALGLSRVDLYPPRTDEFYSMYNVGWIVDGPYSPLDTLSSLQRTSPDHTPLYFLLLNLWGWLVGADVALGRALSAFTALLAAAMIYRLVRDQVSPMAGVFALIVLTSNPVFNFYALYLRMYPLLLLASASVCWSYLRIIVHGRGSRRDYVTLLLASYALANTHAISILLFAALGLFHLLHVKKDRRWLETSLVVVAAAALFSPWAPVLLQQGVSQTFSRVPPGISNTVEVLGSWLAIVFVGSGLLLTLTIACMAFQLGQRGKPWRHIWLISLYFLAALALFTQFIGIIVPGTMRLTTPGVAPFLLLVACICYRAYQARLWLALFVPLWALAGFAYQQSGDWARYLSISGRYTEYIPWHAVSREVALSKQAGDIIGYKFDDFRLNWPAKIDYPQSEFYFAQHGLRVDPAADVAAFKSQVRNRAITAPNLWVMYRRGLVSDDEAARLESVMESANYRACASSDMGFDTVLMLYQWRALLCREPELLLSHENDLVRYEFYGAASVAEGDDLFIIDNWAPRREFDQTRFSLSHQLISDDGQNVASLDLPLESRQGLSQFSIDISSLSPGVYSLVVIVYNIETGERLEWHGNTRAVPAIQPISSITVRE